jgi:glycosyltransferase involved in cell wall biosynthesis
MNTSDKIILIVPYHRSQRGNTLTGRRLLDGLRQRGFNMEVLSLEEPDWQHLLDRKLDASDIGLLHILHIGRATQVLAACPRVRQFPLLLTATGTDINCQLPAPGGENLRTTMQLAKRIVVFGSGFLEILAGYAPETLPKTTVIPQGVFLPPAPPLTRQQLGLQPGDIVFLLPSGLRPVKNLDLALTGLGRLQLSHPQVRLLVMGAPLDPEYANRFVERIGRLPWARYLGEVEHSRMAAYFACSDVVLNTSLAEGQPQAALEGMSMGLPAILSAVPGNLGIIEAGREGYYFKNEEELLDAALNLTESSSLRLEMGHQARLLVERKYSLAAELDSYQRLYLEMGLRRSSLDSYPGQGH